MYSDGLRNYARYPEIHELERIHAGMHALIKDIVRMKKADRSDAAEKVFAKVEPQSEHIVALLTKLEKNVKSGANTGQVGVAV